MALDKKFAGQVIIEKGFASEEAARNWMERMRRRLELDADNVETHLWTDADTKVKS